METLTRCVRRRSAASVAAWRRESARSAARRRRSVAAAWERWARRGLRALGVVLKGERRGVGARGLGAGSAVGRVPVPEHEETELRVRIVCDGDEGGSQISVLAGAWVGRAAPRAWVHHSLSPLPIPTLPGRLWCSASVLLVRLTLTLLLFASACRFVLIRAWAARRLAFSACHVWPTF